MDESWIKMHEEHMAHEAKKNRQASIIAYTILGIMFIMLLLGIDPTRTTDGPMPDKSDVMSNPYD